MSKLSDFLSGLKNHLDRHSREVGKPLIAGVAAGYVVQGELVGIGKYIEIMLLFITLVIFYELFEQIYGRPTKRLKQMDDMETSGPAS